MELFIAVLVLLVLIGLSNILNRFVPFIPIPLIQIVLGVAIALLPAGVHLPLNPELFFVLFIAPLLYNDGKRTPRHELWNLRAPILLLALGLVFVTVVVAGYAIHWLIPTIPLPAAFALAAILSPTDAVAVGAMAGRVHLPKSIHRLLEGEALMNDASGLVAFKFAIAATVTGVFSLAQASFSFILIAIGGLLIGALLSFLLIRLGVWIRRLGMEDVTIHMLLQILTPFVIYLVSEEVGVSGILAVVAGGIIHAIERDRTESVQLKMQVVSASTWSVILFILNGLVFVILGVQIPDVLSTIFENVSFDNLQVLGYVGLISVLLLVLRFVWIYLFWKGNENSGEALSSGKPRLKEVTIITLSGVRGAVTLAGAFSIPYVLQDGSPFPERDLIIFLAAGVILFTLIAASVFLPILAKNEDKAEEGTPQTTERKAQDIMLNAAIRAVKSEMNDQNKAAALAVVSDLSKYIRQAAGELTAGKRKDILKQETAINLIGTRAERKEIENMMDENVIASEAAFRCNSWLDRKEMMLANRTNTQMMFSLSEIGRLFGHVFTNRSRKPDQPFMIENADLFRQVKMRTSEAAIKAIRAHMNDSNRIVALSVISRYERVIAKLRTWNQGKTEDPFDQEKLELQMVAMQEQRNTIQQLYENGEINRDVAAKLRRFINDVEATALKNT
ncbi:MULTISPECIES: Na+/H+ antiporter [Paenibacillus]|uniref:Na+/H+ antiporter n=1 Tax=Paenibacillus TaxID=44249 RepID=UPI0007BEF9BC|nr:MULTISPECIES: Na+/H+ antiporter [Paenibacillus]WDQ35597.1 Na+/H+ antiporter [Paenibacillus marchantiae]SDJ91049.1 sodium/proton antiporter, CPA1 family [Paenibacillus sp. OK060]SEA20494.1 sodium/proton antiporter, CPA1 family (TC 2.A.36) [Paenibacillus sp. 276b]SHN52183.1 sodium/proton antiporter, CPA1 family (TC 2.A.36) [Paenibacillus sp. ov031]SLJ98949.1 sodium/proton antiporter, CPA1 family [Paenibacillus sp. RU5A]